MIFSKIPPLPKARMNIKPAIIGETAIGKSIKEFKMFFPLNLNFVIVQAALNPKIVLNITEIITTKIVSSIAL